MVDGTGVGDVGETVLKDRQRLSSEGVFVILVPVAKDSGIPIGKVEIVPRGFVFVKESKDLMNRASGVVLKSIRKQQDNVKDWSGVKSKIEKDVARFLYDETGRNPLVIAHSISI